MCHENHQLAYKCRQLKNAGKIHSTWFWNNVVNVKLKACVRYFSLFLKEQYVSWLFRTKYFEIKFSLSCFIFPSFHEHLFSPELPRAAGLLKSSCFKKITMCNRDNARHVAAFPDE